MRSQAKYGAAVLAIVVAFGLAASLRAQSLGDVARQARARKDQAGPQNGKVYTNEDIPKPALSGSESSPAPQSSQQSEPQQSESKQGEPGSAATPGTTPSTEPSTPAASGAGDKTAAAPEEKSQAGQEKEYRDKFAKLRENLDLEQRKLDVMQRELNLMQEQYYSDPNMALQQETSRADINKRTADIESQKLTVDKAKQAVSDLEDELRQKGLPPGWAR